jgi:hypothetical protein
MAESAAGSTGRIFISYRREETAYPAGWLFDRLAHHFGAAQVFKDVDSIELGDDFVEVISRAVGACDVLLALIGDQWLTIADVQGRRRLDDPNDFVRLEIEAALRRNVRIVPILVDGANMPRTDELPTGLAGLVRRQALELSPSRFEYDLSRLLRVLDRTLADVRMEVDTAAAIPSSAANAPGEQIGAPQSPKQPEQAKQPGRSSIPAPAPASLAVDRAPGGQTKPPDRQSRRVSMRARVLTGVGAGLLILLVVVVAVFVYFNRRSPQTATVETTTSTPSRQVVFRDNFENRANGWDDAGSTRAGGHYKNGAYYVYAEPGEDSTEVGAPRNASSVYPSAPAGLRIEVDAKAIAIPEGTAYGIGCRMAENGGVLSGYLFTLANDYVNISKYGIDGSYRQLSAATGTPLPSGFMANGTNRFEADCRSGDGDQAVSLVFRVNGQVAAKATDSEDPLTAGTVALLAEAYEESKKAVEVDFDNFAVEAL